MTQTRYQKACEALNYKPLQLSDFDFLPENQRLSFFGEHKAITCIEHANMENGEKWVWNWLSTLQRKWRIWWYATEDKSKPSGAGFRYDVCDYDSADTFVGSRLYMRDADIAKELGNDPEIIEYFNEYLL